MWTHWKVVTTYKPREEALEWNLPCPLPWSWTSQPPQLWKINVSCLSWSVWYSVMLAQTKISPNRYFICTVFFFFNLFFLAALDLHCCTWASSSCGEWGYSSLQCLGFSFTVASLVVEHGLQGMRDSLVVAYGLSCSTACGVFQDQGSNLCLLHWQEYS